MEKELLDKLDTIVGQYKQKQVYVIQYNDENLVLPSGKSSWSSIGAAKNALRNFLYPVGNWRTRLEEIKKVEDKGIIKYVKIF